MTDQLTAADFEMRYDADHTFPFFETEDAVIMAWGHPDKAELAAQVMDFDTLCNGEPPYSEPHPESDLQRVWATVERYTVGEDMDRDEGWMCTWSGVTAETPGAVALTVIFR